MNSEIRKGWEHVSSLELSLPEVWLPVWKSYGQIESNHVEPCAPSVFGESITESLEAPCSGPLHPQLSHLQDLVD